MKNKYLEDNKLSAVLFGTAFLLYTIVYMTKTMFSAAMASIVEVGIMSKSQVGAINAGFWAVYAVGQIVGGFAVDKYSPVKLIIVGLVGGVAANMVIYFNQSYNVILIAWCLNAAFQFAIWPGVFKILSTQVAPEFRPVAVFWILFATSVGEIISMLVASVVSNWKYNFIICALGLMIVIFLWVVIYTKLKGYMTGSEDAQTNNKIYVSKWNMGAVVSVSGLPILMIVSLLVTMVFNSIKMLTPVMLMESYDAMPAAIATRLSMIMVVFTMLGMFCAKFVRSRITQHELKAAALLLSCGIPTMALVSMVGKIPYIAVLGFLIVTIVSLQSVYPFTNTFVSRRFVFCGRTGTVAGLLNAMGSMGNICASYLFPKFSEFMSWKIIVIIWCSMSILAIVLSLSITRKWTSFIKKEQL